MLTYKAVGGRGVATRSLPSDEDVEELYIFTIVRSSTKVLTRNQRWKKDIQKKCTPKWRKYGMVQN